MREQCPHLRRFRWLMCLLWRTSLGTTRTRTQPPAPGRYRSLSFVSLLGENTGRCSSLLGDFCSLVAAFSLRSLSMYQGRARCMLDARQWVSAGQRLNTPRRHAPHTRLSPARAVVGLNAALKSVVVFHVDVNVCEACRSD